MQMWMPGEAVVVVGSLLFVVIGSAAESPSEPGEPVLPSYRPLSWDAAYTKAESILAWMEAGDKNALLRGIGWDIKLDEHMNVVGFDLKKDWYVGNTAAVSRLGVPSLNLQDASGGFRTYWNDMVGTVTCWPSQLALAATWSPASVQKFAVALGREFAGKGANGVLGPAIEVHRVARNGRNFEYLSGEDPYLGARLAAAYVTGVQSEGILAIAKHWVMNHQETQRQYESSNIDDKTAWELYYPPFQAAIDAGVSAIMCSYNKINGQHSCSNPHQLQAALKEKMGFRGFIQSDWWALDQDFSGNRSLALGLDQDMPGWPVEKIYYSEPSLVHSTAQLAEQTPHSVDGAVKRILAAMLRMGLENSTKCAPPYCQAWLQRNVTNTEHVALARSLAAESIVLLKNAGNLLPLSNSTRTIAVIGTAAAAEAWNPAGAGQGVNDAWHRGDYYSGGGSGHVVAANVVTPLEGLRRRAALAGIDVISSPSNDVAEALAAAQRADVVIVVAATTSGESEDRPDLSLDDRADDLIAALAAEGHGNRTVLLAQLPGAVLMPWRNSVASILVLFLGGQETGNAWADVLFGDHAPSGRLPVMMPATLSDTIEPSMSLEINYTEGLATSYRNRNFSAAFPFGHGLTYTTFEFSAASQTACPEVPNGTPLATLETLVPGAPGSEETTTLCVQLRVTNNGSVAASTVAQLYLELPEVSGHPTPFLKGFERTGKVTPGNSSEVTFRLTRRDVSYFDALTAAWVVADSAVAHIAESSALSARRQSLRLSLDGLDWQVATSSTTTTTRVSPSSSSTTTTTRVSPSSSPSSVTTSSNISGCHRLYPPVFRLAALAALMALRHL
ncbi:unnamed protein product [Polarella glacialis]|uniref:Probable beta-glucosidase G n=1 Tax=Polarella glacialis TaxID=89957 RepID=A0A813FFD2_POLGL|nr:unnamed protein product [Polarella glacialis]